MRFIEDFVFEDMSKATKQASPEGLASFVNAKFGMSTHWGLYSINGRGEWLLFQEQIPESVYKERVAEFNPTRFDAEEWADLMVEAGQKFFFITAKHHDGFCLWDTQLTDFNISNTPYKKDILAQLAPALADRGIKLHFYYSLVDWTYPGYRNDWPAYVNYYQGQLRELLTNYGEIGGVIFDGCWPRCVFEEGMETDYFAPRGEWDLAGTHNLIHELQPNAVIVNNSHVLPFPGEDYQIWELDMPGENTIGFNTTEVGDKPTSVWWNLNGGWAYAPVSHNVKSADTILASMRKAHSRGAVFSLNVGPRPFGDIHPEEQQVLREIGRKIKQYGLLD